MAYPATFNIERPTHEFDKTQVVLRIAIVIVIGWLANWIVGAAYWVLPILAAVMISQKGPEQYLADGEKGPVRWIRYLLAFFNYISLATDKLAFDDPDSVDFKVTTTGKPTVGSALLRIILGIPHAIVLGIIGIAFIVVWIISAISILVNGTYPEWAFGFIRGYLRWNARVLAYMASLVDEYPPFSFENGAGMPASPAAGAPPAPPAAAPPPVAPPASSASQAPSPPPTPHAPGEGGGGGDGH
jgi:hypothetical protein